MLITGQFPGWLKWLKPMCLGAVGVVASGLALLVSKHVSISIQIR